MVDHTTLQFNKTKQLWETAIPEPYYHSLFPWLYKRLTGYRDAYGRKAQLFWHWQ